MATENQTAPSTSAAPSTGKLGLLALIAVVVSSMLGGGVFSLPQNTAASSALDPILIAWVIAGIGMYFVANTFRMLSDMHPDLQAGVYMYGQEGFGRFIGFIVAWGYWLMSCFGNVAFAIILMDSLNLFFPGVFTDGNNITSIICGSTLIWDYNFLVLSGEKTAWAINTIGTITKLIPLVLFVIILGVVIDYSQLFSNAWGTNPAITTEVAGHATPTSLAAQIMAPMTVTLWAFIGVEGAVVLSGRARNPRDVGKATLIGFVLALIISIFISTLPFGIMDQAALAKVANPSTAGVLSHAIGAKWGEWLMSVGLIISVLAGWLAWTMLCAEIPMVAGQNGVYPKIFSRTNSKRAASVSLWVSSAVMQAAMLLVYFSNNAWSTMYNIASLMVIPAYFFSTLYMVKLCLKHEFHRYAKKGFTLAIIGGVVGALFCIFILYASSLQYVVLVPLLITFGLPIFIWARVEKKDGKPIFEKQELIYLAILLLLDVLVIWALITHKVAL